MNTLSGATKIKPEGNIPTRRREIVFMLSWDRKKDMTDAKNFGRVVYILRPKHAIYPDNCPEVVDEIRKAIRSVLEENSYDPEYDFFVMNGDPISMAIAMLEIMPIADRKMRLNPFVRFLKWDKEESLYYEVEVVL